MHDMSESYVIGTATEVARAVTTRGEVLLRRRPAGVDGAILELRVNGVFVMDTHETATERALATEALTLVTRPRRVLVGGLGLGFTVRELIADARVEHIEVVEIEDALIRWTRDGTVPDGGMLSDPRLRIVQGDVTDVIQETPDASYDLVLLDVDNGPDHLVYDENAAIYREPLLRRLRRLLPPGGVVVVWSSSAAPDLLEALRSTFETVQERAIDVRLGERAEQYFLYLGRTGDVVPAAR